MAAPAPPAFASQDELNAIVCGVLPRQGAWSDEEYLWLTDRSRRLIEFTDGYVQELPVPTFSHQAILAFLYRLFHGWIGPRDPGRRPGARWGAAGVRSVLVASRSHWSVESRPFLAWQKMHIILACRH